MVGEPDIHYVSETNVVEDFHAQLLLHFTYIDRSRDVVEVNFNSDRLNFVMDVHRQILRKSILKGDHRLEEQLTRPDILCIVEVMVVDVNQRGVVHILAYHLWQEIAEQAHKPFDVFLASEEDFFPRDGGLP